MLFALATSTPKIMAQMMTAASEALGIKAKAGMKHVIASTTTELAKTPAPGERTPLAELTAERLNEPVMGIPERKEPSRLPAPKDNSS